MTHSPTQTEIIQGALCTAVGMIATNTSLDPLASTTALLGALSEKLALVDKNAAAALLQAHCDYLRATENPLAYPSGLEPIVGQISRQTATLASTTLALAQS